ncbi:putative RNA helicase armi isoform X1 [Anticarsia gemmatalis]|uniref:putative RNA helicase armi isoform X1 n=1 Tax=Anticarsia gemmatalis TaxID=129554 RepID=UPI003F76F781
MTSFIKSIYSYFFPSSDKTDEYKERFLSQELSNLESDELETAHENDPSTPQKGRDAVSYQRTGIITYIENNTVLIDGMLFFDKSSCKIKLQIKDKVLYVCRKDESDAMVVVRIIENQGIYWGDPEDAVEENTFKVIEHVFVGQVEYRQDRAVVIKNSNLEFDLDKVTATFIPIEGDWLEILCKVQFNDDNPMNISLDEVVEVLSFKALRSKCVEAVITEWTGESGICSKIYYFNKHCIVNDTVPSVGSGVFIEVIESNQGIYTWRVIRMEIKKMKSFLESNPIVLDDDIEDKSLAVEIKHNIEVTYPLKFDNVKFLQNPSTNLKIQNNGDEHILLFKWVILCKKRDSQISVSPFLTKPRKINPGESFNLTIKCNPKFFGRNKEHLILMFRGFQVDRFIEINIQINNLDGVTKYASSETPFRTELEKLTMLKNIRNDAGRTILAGEKLQRTPNFISVRLGLYPVPQKVWNAVLGDPNETVLSIDFNKIISRIETKLPCLMQPLNINNYTDRWHTLLYMEEVQAHINMRIYDIEKGYLIHCQQYLGIEVNGLAEKRPSLMEGDQVIVKNIWDNELPSYEGIIHSIKGSLVLMKFHPLFHETYSGSDVSIQFQVHRSVFRRAHHAINLAICNLGADVLFPSRIIQTASFQIPKNKLDEIEWYNKCINDGQKAAVKNILLGECQAMPYCIYGPPGTGKTITVIETILQIITLRPDSRILVAAPSNSAADLIAERLLQYKHLFSNSIVRVIANHLVNSDNIPDIVKPYCATVNIAREETGESMHEVMNGINIKVAASYIARHRICIGTCCGLGVLATLGLPKGHFTHVIVDEAGQAVEPDSMIPLTFIDKKHGQIILAGDPMQLGPCVMSKYCKDFGYDKSFMVRILETFPYQRDYHAYAKGFNEKLVTRLSENYRSLEEVIALPSEMFYDSTLVAKFNRNTPMVERLLDVVSEIFEVREDIKTGGIFVHGVKGNNTRSEDSPSWFNPQEASMVALTVCKLFKKNVSPDEIGIITPYVAQVKYIRLLFDAMGLPRPKIGSVEDFQGQERPLIILSTVRTTESYIIEDQRLALGFLRNPKRLNVALTRAQVAVLLFCDPHLLSCDPLWQKVINNACKSNKYMGCSSPFTSENNDNKDTLNKE